MTAGRLILDDGESTCDRRGTGDRRCALLAPDEFDRALPRFPSASR